MECQNTSFAFLQLVQNCRPRYYCITTTYFSSTMSKFTEAMSWCFNVRLKLCFSCARHYADRRARISCSMLLQWSMCSAPSRQCPHFSQGQQDENVLCLVAQLPFHQLSSLKMCGPNLVIEITIHAWFPSLWRSNSCTLYYRDKKKSFCTCRNWNLFTICTYFCRGAITQITTHTSSVFFSSNYTWSVQSCAWL